MRCGFGAFVGIVTAAIPAGYLQMGPAPTVGLIAPFGASAVLLFGAPRTQMAQPRNVVGGHVISAGVGVTVCHLLPSSPLLAAAAAVATAIVAMHLTCTVHPPGGATALIAVVGGPEIEHLGYAYLVTPVLVGVLSLVVVALVANNLTHDTRRNYPVRWW